MSWIALALLIGCPSGPNAQQRSPAYTKEQIDELKKQNERAQNQNTLIKQAMEAMTAKNWQAAVAPLQQLIADDPNNWQYHSAMGDVQFNLGSYAQAVDAYQKGIQLAEHRPDDSKNPDDDPAKKKAAIGKMLTQQGSAYLKLRKNTEAVAAYTKAASNDPNPGTAYFNLCAVQYNTGNVDAALGACDKAIAADPSKADAYFIKGSLLIAGSTTDPSGKVKAPSGAAEALKKYLELAPNGAHAGDVKQMLGFIGSTVETTYKKGKGR
jgi:tetratricopeptide (TPR) repeat protein